VPGNSQLPVLAMVGLGRMGGNMLRRLAGAGLAVTGYDASSAAGAALAGVNGITVASSLSQLVASLRAPRAVWIMLPAGEITEQTIAALGALLLPGDIIIDGGNADYHDSVRHAATLAQRGVHFVDVGVSGGIWGLAEGYGLMFGGAPEAVQALMPVFRALAPAADKGWVHCGPVGSGHYAKMVHNGIEYGLMQAYAEGFALLQAKQEFKLDLGAIAQAWRSGTVVRSWLLDLAATALQQDGTLAGVAPVVADSGEGRWSVREGLDLGVPVPAISAALNVRLASQGRGDYAAKFLSRLRNVFGGHPMQTTGKP